MAYDRIAAYNPDLWGVSQEDFDNNDLVAVRLYNVNENDYQHTGEPINQYPFICRTLEDSPKTNPLSYQYFCFGMCTVAQALYDHENVFSEVEKKVVSPSLVGYCLGADNASFHDKMGGVGSSISADTGDGDNSTYVGNNAFNNGMRWYTNKTNAGDTTGNYYQNQIILKIKRENLVLGVSVYVCPPLSDLEQVPSDSPYTSPREMTLKEWLTGDNQANYPNIVSIKIRPYYGTATLRELDTRIGIYTDVNTYVDDIWLKTTIDEVAQTWDKTLPRYGRCSPADIKVRSYLPSISLFMGVNVRKGSYYYQTAWFCSRGLDMHRFVRYFVGTGASYDPRAISFFSGTVEDIYNALDCLGMPWTEDDNKLRTGDVLNDPSIHVPVISRDGATKGHTDDPEKKRKELDKNPYGANVDPTTWAPEYSGPDPENPDDPAYDPEDDPEEDKEADEVEMGNPALGTVGVFNRSYAINSEELHALSSYLWNVDSTEFEKIIKGLGLMGNNPINAIISVIMFPFEIEGGAQTNIRIGVVDTEITASPINYTNTKIYNLGECYFWAKYKNYLDYEPYTTAALYIPYVGIIPIPVSEYLKKWISVRLAVDLMTGSGQVVVYANGIPTIYRNCKIGCQIAVTGQDSSRIAANYISAVSEIVGAGTGLAQSVASGNAGGIVGGSMSAAHGAIDLYTAGHVPIESRGSDSPQCGFYMPQQCYLIINRPNPANIDLATYGATIGFACCEAGVIGNFVGFSKFDNVQLNITTATEAEKREIIDKLRGGVYV